MLSKANIKYIKSLQVKKYRKQEQCFMVEGAKSVQELLRSDFEVLQVVATVDFLKDATNIRGQLTEASQAELSSLGEFQSNNSAVAVARMKPNLPLAVSDLEFALMLDDIRDPGNLGTIIRTADWYGISKVIASSETADFYNPKVITSTMGSFTRVSVYYTELKDFLVENKIRSFGAFLQGADIHDLNFGSGGLIVIGNESHGIRTDLEPLITEKITIPRYGHAESLNAAIATAIICDNIARNIGKKR